MDLSHELARARACVRIFQKRGCRQGKGSVFTPGNARSGLCHSTLESVLMLGLKAAQARFACAGIGVWGQREGGGRAGR